MISGKPIKSPKRRRPIARPAAPETLPIADSTTDSDKGRIALTAWGLSVQDSGAETGNLLLGEEQLGIKQPMDIKILEALAASDKGRLTFLELRGILSQRYGNIGNDPIHTSLARITELFEQRGLPYFSNVVDQAAQQRIITLELEGQAPLEADSAH